MLFFRGRKKRAEMPAHHSPLAASSSSPRGPLVKQSTLKKIYDGSLLTSRSRTQRRTSLTKPSFSAALIAAILARAVPHEPDPMTATLSMVPGAR